MWSTRSVLLTVTLVASLASLAQGQGYGASDDDDLPQQQPNKFPQNNQQISALPQYESTENFQQPHQPQQQQGNNNNAQNLWWMGQNAFQRPAGHPGVEMLDPKNPGGQQAQQGNTNRNPNSYNPPAQGHNAFGGGQSQQQNQPQFNNPGPQQQHNNNQGPQNQYNNPGPQDQPQNQFNNPGPQNQPQNQFNNQGPQDQPQNQFNNAGPQNQPQNQFNNPGPQQQPQNNQFNNQRPQDQQQQPQNQYNNPSPQQPQFNNPGPQQQQQFNPAPQQQFNNAGAGQQPGAGWNAPQQQQRPSGSGFGQPDEAPGCDLVNKADCHNKGHEPQAPPQNNFNAPKPQQNYQPPPLNPEPFPQQQQQYQPPPPQQKPIQEPNLAYRPPPPQQQPSQQAPSPNSYNRPADSQPSFPNQNNFQNQLPRQQQPPYQPPQVPRPPPQQQFQNSGQGVRPSPPKQQQRQPAADTGELPPYPGCPAAMLCVQDDYCNTIGLIEDSPIQLSAADKLHRVALMQCSEPMTGIVGVCCRDPNYKDPWPDMQGGGGMMKKDGGAHHHPDKGQPNQGHSQALGNGIAHQPPQGNHLSSGNPYSGPGGGNRNMGWNRNNPQCNTGATGGYTY